jgi:hypothetical protein
VKRTSVGIVKEYDSKNKSKVHVAFKSSPDAQFLDFELERVYRVGDRVKSFDFAAASAAAAASVAAAAAAAAAAQHAKRIGEGDLVRSTADPKRTGTVTKDDGTSNPYKVRWDDTGDESPWMEPDKIEKIPPAIVPTTTSFQALSSTVPLPANETFIVTSTYPVSVDESQRGIVVSSLDLSRHYVVTSNDIAPARRNDYTKIRYRKGDLVQLHATSAAVADTRCLGTLPDKRWGVVIKPGVMRGKIARNIVVAAEGGFKTEPTISLYTSMELMPFSRASVFTNLDQASLVKVIEDLNYAVVLAIQSPEVIVGKFGSRVFCKLWAIFHKNKSYDLALEAFQRWQVSRKDEPLLSHSLKLLLDSANGGSGCVPIAATPEGGFDDDKYLEEGCARRSKEELISTWHCSVCIVENDKKDKECQVCGAKVPTWTCPSCIAESSIVMSCCQHCKNPQPAMPRLRRKLTMNPGSAFAIADVDGSEDLTFAEWQRAFGDNVIGDNDLRRLFDEFDTNGDGRVSLDEFRAGLDRDNSTRFDVNKPSSGKLVCVNRAPNDAENLPCSAPTGEIKVYVANCNGRTPFRINKKSPVQELMDLYCSQEGIDPLGLTFLFQGKELKCSYTPDQLKMLDPCTIFCIPDASASLLQLLTFPTLSSPSVQDQKEKKHGTTEITVKKCSEKKARFSPSKTKSSRADTLFEVDKIIPKVWRNGVHYHVQDSDRFEVDEICVIKRSDGTWRFGKILKIESEMNYEVQVSISHTKAGIPGDNLGKIISQSSSAAAAAASAAGLTEPPGSAAFKRDLNTVSLLLEMGFPEVRIHAALDELQCNSVERATEWLFNHADDAGAEDEVARQPPVKGAERAVACDNTPPLEAAETEVSDTTVNTPPINRGDEEVEVEDGVKGAERAVACENTPPQESAETELSDTMVNLWSIGEEDDNEDEDVDEEGVAEEDNKKEEGQEEV